MDTLTHLVLGACIGEVAAGRKLGKKVLLLGALAQNIPDADIVASFWLPPTSDLLAHRGFTHSFLFILIIAPLLAGASVLLSKNTKMRFDQWVLFWGIQVFIHIFIDAFNVYGTGWFEPFSHYRISFNTLFVADPLFILGPATALTALMVLKKDNLNRKLWAKAALVLCSAYLLCSICFKMMIHDRLTRQLALQNKPARKMMTTPTPLNIFFWYNIAENDSGFNIGYSSILDKKEHIDFHFAPRNDALLKLSTNNTDKANLIRFSQGYYSASLKQDTLLFNDLRFGEILGWESAQPGFVLYYYLQYPDNNKMLVQRGRFAGWNKAAVLRFIHRIQGNQ